MKNHVWQKWCVKSVQIMRGYRTEGKNIFGLDRFENLNSPPKLGLALFEVFLNGINVFHPCETLLFRVWKKIGFSSYFYIHPMSRRLFRNIIWCLFCGTIFWQETKICVLFLSLFFFQTFFFWQFLLN